jgi:hypothetical protein
MKLSPTEEGLLIQEPGGDWKGGWAYSVVAGFICSIWEQEFNHPGAYKVAIATLREAIKTAQVIPAGTKVAVDKTIPYDSPYAKDTVENLPERISVTVTATQTGYEFEVPTSDQAWQILQLPEANTRWVLPQTVSQPQQAELELA